MRTSFVADVEPTTATMNIGPFTFTEAHLSQEKITWKRETEEKKKALHRKALCTHLFKEEDRKGDFWHF